MAGSEDKDKMVFPAATSNKDLPPTLVVRPSQGNKKQLGVWCISPIDEGEIFGPFMGEKLKKLRSSSDSAYVWEIVDERTGKYLYSIDATNPAKSNWMRHVKCALFSEDQNLVSVQRDGNIFYRAIREITPDEELLVWYELVKTRKKNNKAAKPKKQVVESSKMKKDPASALNIDIVQKENKSKNVDIESNKKNSPKTEKKTSPQKKPSSAKSLQDSVDEALMRISENQRKIKDYEQRMAQYDESIDDAIAGVVGANGKNPKSMPSKPGGTNVEPKKIKVKLQEFSNKVRSLLKKKEAFSQMKKAVNFKSKIEISPKKYSSKISKPLIKQESKTTEKIPCQKKDKESAKQKKYFQGDDGNETTDASVLNQKANPEDSIKLLQPRPEKEYIFDLKDHHSVTGRMGRKIFKCDICSGVYRQAFSLKRHYIRNHVNYKYLSDIDIRNCNISPRMVQLQLKTLKHLQLQIGDKHAQESAVSEIDSTSDNNSSNTCSLNLVSSDRSTEISNSNEEHVVNDKNEVMKGEVRRAENELKINNFNENPETSHLEITNKLEDQSQSNNIGKDKITAVTANKLETHGGKTKESEIDSCDTTDKQNVENVTSPIEGTRDIFRNEGNEVINGVIEKCDENNMKIENVLCYSSSKKNLECELQSDEQNDNKDSCTKVCVENGDNDISDCATLTNIEGADDVLTNSTVGNHDEDRLETENNQKLDRSENIVDSSLKSPVVDTQNIKQYSEENVRKDENNSDTPKNAQGLKKQKTDTDKDHKFESKSSLGIKSTEDSRGDDFDPAMPVLQHVSQHLAGLYWCNTCGQLVDTVDELKSHLKNHPALEKSDAHTSYRYSCNQCDMKFTQKQNLIRHSAVHTGAKPYSCQYCGKSFPTSRNQRRHEKIHLGEKFYSCVYCDNTFSKSGNLKNHVRFTHPLLFHECKLCKKYFPNAGLLQDHAKTHDKEAWNKFNEKQALQEKAVENILNGLDVDSNTNTKRKREATKRLYEEEEYNASKNVDPSSFRFSCTVCKKKFSTYANMCRHRILQHERNGKVVGRRKPELLDKKRAQTPSKRRRGVTCPQPTPEEKEFFYANVAQDIATNMSYYIDGKRPSLDKCFSHIKSYDKFKNGMAGLNYAFQHRINWAKYNLPANFNFNNFNRFTHVNFFNEKESEPPILTRIDQEEIDCQTLDLTVSTPPPLIDAVILDDKSVDSCTKHEEQNCESCEIDSNEFIKVANVMNVDSEANVVKDEEIQDYECNGDQSKNKKNILGATTGNGNKTGQVTNFDDDVKSTEKYTGKSDNNLCMKNKNYSNNDTSIGKSGSNTESSISDSLHSDVISCYNSEEDDGKSVMDTENKISNIDRIGVNGVSDKMKGRNHKDIKSEKTKSHTEADPHMQKLGLRNVAHLDKMEELTVDTDWPYRAVTKYMCNVCKYEYLHFDDLMTHQDVDHPNVVCNYIELGDEENIPVIYSPCAVGALNIMQTSVADANSQMAIYSCTKCFATFTEMSQLHCHIIACANGEKKAESSDVHKKLEKDPGLRKHRISVKRLGTKTAAVKANVIKAKDKTPEKKTEKKFNVTTNRKDKTPDKKNDAKPNADKLKGKLLVKQSPLLNNEAEIAKGKKVNKFKTLKGGKLPKNSGIDIKFKKKIHSSGTKPKKKSAAVLYVCLNCNLKFSSAILMRNHKKICHKKKIEVTFKKETEVTVKQESPSKAIKTCSIMEQRKKPGPTKALMPKYECDDCGKKFIYTGSYEKHLLGSCPAFHAEKAGTNFKHSTPEKSSKVSTPRKELKRKSMENVITSTSSKTPAKKKVKQNKENLQIKNSRKTKKTSEEKTTKGTGNKQVLIENDSSVVAKVDVKSKTIVTGILLDNSAAESPVTKNPVSSKSKNKTKTTKCVNSVDNHTPKLKSSKNKESKCVLENDASTFNDEKKKTSKTEPKKIRRKRKRFSLSDMGSDDDGDEMTNEELIVMKFKGRKRMPIILNNENTVSSKKLKAQVGNKTGKDEHETKLTTNGSGSVKSNSSTPDTVTSYSKSTSENINKKASPKLKKKKLEELDHHYNSVNYDKDIIQAKDTKNGKTKKPSKTFNKDEEAGDKVKVKPAKKLKRGLSLEELMKKFSQANAPGVTEESTDSKTDKKVESSPSKSEENSPNKYNLDSQNTEVSSPNSIKNKSPKLK